MAAKVQSQTDVIEALKQTIKQLSQDIAQRDAQNTELKNEVAKLEEQYRHAPVFNNTDIPYKEWPVEALRP